MAEQKETRENDNARAKPPHIPAEAEDLLDLLLSPIRDRKEAKIAARETERVLVLRERANDEDRAANA